MNSEPDPARASLDRPADGPREGGGSAVHVPGATYRLQMRKEFGFEAARALVPYLQDLGITDLYLSPIFRARPGSQHGYDVTDPTRLNPELGTSDEFDALCGELKARGMGLVLDIVPNHMAVSYENRFWRDVVENGPASQYADFFDIAWDYEEPRNPRILIPSLGRPFGVVLEEQELVLRMDGGFDVRYFDKRYPIDPRTWGMILAQALPELIQRLGTDHPAVRGVYEALAVINRIPSRDHTGSAARHARREGKRLAQRVLRALYKNDPEFRSYLKETLRTVNGRKGEPESFDVLEQLLDDQAYRLSYWKTATEAVGYRRFFDISDLVGVRVEDPRVFRTTHRLIVELARAGKIRGLRVDHIDGLFDPLGYLRRLRAAIGGQKADFAEELSRGYESGRPWLPPRFQPSGRGAHDGPDRADTGRRDTADVGGGSTEAGAETRQPQPYLVVEKILTGDETLPDQWPVEGTTGYDTLNLVESLSVDPGGFRELEKAFLRLLRSRTRFRDQMRTDKLHTLEGLLAGEVAALSRQLERIARRDRHARHLPPKALHRAVTEITALLPVYRTYLRDLTATPEDRRRLEELLDTYAAGDPDPELLGFMRRLFLLELPRTMSEERRSAWLRFVMHWQQLTSPAMAKGLEDTTHYVYVPLLTLNEVGGEPAAADDPVAAFHRRVAERAARWPVSMNASSTHDSKRGEDVRARLSVLSEIPGEWKRHFGRWSRMHRSLKRELEGRKVPGPRDEWFLYQTLVGMWPLEQEDPAVLAERVRECMRKAAREAKTHTSWLRPDAEYEEALLAYASAVVDPADTRFREDFEPFQAKVAWYGALNGLAHTLIKIALPGVPDFYQGAELWDLSLVDPDNRRAVDFVRRSFALHDLGELEFEGAQVLTALFQTWRDGRIKLFTIRRALACRLARRELFERGEYIPLSASGDKARHVVAFARRRDAAWAVAAVPRLPASLAPVETLPLGDRVWGSGRLSLPAGAPQRWRDVISGAEIPAEADPDGTLRLPLARVFERFPGALLESLS